GALAPLEQPSVREFAVRFGNLRSLYVTVEWAYRRAPNPLRGVLLRRFRRARFATRRSAEIKMDVTSLKKAVIVMWRGHDMHQPGVYEPLIAVASGEGSQDQVAELPN